MRAWATRHWGTELRSNESQDRTCRSGEGGEGERAQSSKRQGPGRAHQLHIMAWSLLCPSIITSPSPSAYETSPYPIHEQTVGTRGRDPPGRR